MDAGTRSYLVMDLPLRGSSVGTISASLFEHFFDTLSRNSRMTIHIKASGKDDHHMVEAVFKAAGRAMREAFRIQEKGKGQASTKGSL